MKIVQKTKQSAPFIFYGTAWKKQKTAGLVQLALKSGFRGIDTACQPKHYNQKGVGEGIVNSKIPRNQIFIQTKFTPFGGQDPNNIPYDPKQSLKNQVLTSFKVSQKNLHTQTIDSLVLHSPLQTFQATLQVWRTFEELYEKGNVHYLGISNCYNLKFFENLYNQAKVKPSFLQNRFYQESGYDKGLRKFCNEHGIRYQSFWTLTANPHILQSEQMKKLSSKYKRTPAQLLYKVLSQMQIIPLIGTTSEEHMKQDLSIKDLKIQKEQVQIVKKLFSV